MNDNINKAMTEVANGLLYMTENLELLTEELQKAEKQTDNLVKVIEQMTKDSGCKHAWHSAKAEEKFGFTQYKRLNGELVSVTCVSETYLWGEKEYCWNDKVYLGLVKGFHKSFHKDPFDFLSCYTGWDDYKFYSAPNWHTNSWGDDFDYYENLPF